MKKKAASIMLAAGLVISAAPANVLADPPPP